MEHAKKFILVPEERARNFAAEHLSELDQKMKSILLNSKIDDSEKITLYLQILQKFVNFHRPQEKSENAEIEEKEKVSEKEELEAEKDVSVEDSKFLSENEVKQESETIEMEIERAAPKKLKHLTLQIIKFFQENKKEIFWSPQKELVIDGKIIPNTNIVDLIIHLVRDRKGKPRAYELFYDILKRKKFPLTFIKNKHLKMNGLYAKPIPWIEY